MQKIKKILKVWFTFINPRVYNNKCKATKELLNINQEERIHMNNTMNILETITEEINLKFDDLAIAKVKGEYIHLISQNRRAKDCWEMEQQMEEIFEYVIDKFDVELNIVNYGQRTLVVEVYTY